MAPKDQNHPIVIGKSKPVCQLMLVILSYLIVGSVLAHTDVNSSCVIDHPLTVIEVPESQHQRMLQSSDPHPYKIFGHFPQETETRIDIGLLRNIFNIAAKYFYNVIKVTNLPANLLQYPENSDRKCGVQVPKQFLQGGFDQNFMDIVVFIVIEYDKGKSFVAAAAPCIKIRRPIYGYVIYNAAFV